MHVPYIWILQLGDVCNERNELVGYTVFTLLFLFLYGELQLRDSPSFCLLPCLVHLSPCSTPPPHKTEPWSHSAQGVALGMIHGFGEKEDIDK